MPYLKTILVNATDKSNRMLRAKAMECISLVGMAVGKDIFKEDAKQVKNWKSKFVAVVFVNLSICSWCLVLCFIGSILMYFL